MAVAFFDTKWAADRLRAQVGALREVGVAADFSAAAQSVPKQLPAAYVVDLSSAPAPNPDGTGGVSQHTVFRFGVILALQNVRDARGEAAQQDLTSLRQSVATALMGWPPAEEFDPCEMGPGRVLQFADLVLWWQDDYLTRTLLRSE